MTDRKAKAKAWGGDFGLSGTQVSDASVKFREMVYRESLDILYICGEVFGVSRKRSTIVERFLAGSISRTRVLQ